MDAYLSLVPRGLEVVVCRIVEEKLRGWNVQLSVRGERPASAVWLDGLRQQVAQSRDKRKQVCMFESCRRPVGTVPGTDKRDVSLGYHSSIEALWTTVGQLQGVVWLQLETDAPAEVVVVQLRCLGPFLSLVNVWGDDGTQNLDLTGDRSLDDIVDELSKLLGSNYSLTKALLLWLECVKASWNLSAAELAVLEEKLEGQQPLRFRLSCLRNESKKYSFSRQEFLAAIAEKVVPITAEAKGWIVDLQHFDLEVVLLFRPHALAIGLVLRPYQLFDAKSFSAGVVPPDIHPPYLSGSIMSGLVRLRPSTANILLHLAALQPGDIVLDPCAGIGTIPVESSTSLFPSVVALGGDLVLTPGGLGCVAAEYMTKARHAHASSSSRKSSLVDVAAWDACHLPLRSETVDAIVSDLPFGQLCLSSHKLSQIMPLLVTEMARVLRRGTGRMVLLCGSHNLILDVLRSGMWKLPCDSVFPVNIGGLLAWIIIVHRSDEPAVMLPKQSDRVRQLTGKRERLNALVKNGTSGNAKRLQS